MAPQSPDKYRWETWWYYAQGGPGVFRGDLYFYTVDGDAREKVARLIHAPSAKDIVFVRGTTEGINLIAHSYGGQHVGR